MPSSTHAEALLTELRVRGPRSGPELERLLGVSQPTLSRVVRALVGRGDVLVVGAARQTRYAARRTITELVSPIPVFEAGTLTPLVWLHPIHPRGFYVADDGGCPDLVGFYDDLPWFLQDLRPQGFLGRLIPRLHPALGLPRDVHDWSGDHVLRWLCREGVDVAGDLVVGEAVARRTMEAALPSGVETTAQTYGQLCESVLAGGTPGSSAGGEQPKFLTFCEGRHVLVKFSPPLTDPVSCRIGDLLRAEHLALRRVAASGHLAADSRLIEGEGRVFLEVVRFDRVGARGRTGVVSLHSLDCQYVGSLVSWTQSAELLFAAGLITAAARAEVRWLEQFGILIANTDRHHRNLNFTMRRGKIGALAPLYDMLPMHFYPRAGTLVDLPMPLNLPRDGDWQSARDAALAFWADVESFPSMSNNFREVAVRCRGEIVASLPG